MKILAVGILGILLLSVAANAQSPLHYDFTQELKGLDGKPLLRNSDGTPKPMTLGDAAVEALEASSQADRNSSGLDKFKRDELARKIYGKKDVSLSIDEIKQIKDRIGEIEPTMIVGVAWRLLDKTQN